MKHFPIPAQEYWLVNRSIGIPNMDKFTIPIKPGGIIHMFTSFHKQLTLGYLQWLAGIMNSWTGSRLVWCTDQCCLVVTCPTENYLNQQQYELITEITCINIDNMDNHM